MYDADTSFDIISVNFDNLNLKQRGGSLNAPLFCRLSLSFLYMEFGVERRLIECYNLLCVGVYLHKTDNANT